MVQLFYARRAGELSRADLRGHNLRNLMTTASPNLTVRIRAHARIEGGQFVSEKNLHKIRVRSLHVQRGCDSSWRPYFDPATYKETWVARKHPQKGYIFLEVKHGGGISGFHKTLRGLILSVAFDDSKEVIVTDEPAEITPDGERRIQQTLWGRMIAA